MQIHDIDRDLRQTGFALIMGILGLLVMISVMGMLL